MISDNDDQVIIDKNKVQNKFQTNRMSQKYSNEAIEQQLDSAEISTNKLEVIKLFNFLALKLIEYLSNEPIM